MMAAYQPQPGAMHPGMAPQGHPAMAQGQPMNPAQMQQIAHPGPVTPGPHVTQGGAMMGMQPGANTMGGPAGIGVQHPGGQMGGMPAQMGGQSMAGGVPNAHALSQMNPQAALQQQQIMQQHLNANPHLAMQQHALMQRRMAAMQQANNNNMANMQQGNMQGLNPQQIQQLQQNNPGMQPQGVQLPQHLQMQQMQIRLQQQQHAQNQQLQQQMAMHHSASQANNSAAQPSAQNQPGGQQQQQPGQPMRPQSRVGNANEQGQGAPQQQNAQPQQPTQQNANQQQQQQQQQQQSQQQQGQANQQQGPGNQPQQQTPTAAQMQALQRQRHLQMQQQTAMQQRMQAQQAQQQSSSGAFILKVMLFGDQLSAFDSETGQDIAMWHNFVDKHFAPDARFLHTFAPVPSPEDNNKPRAPKRYEVPRATIARYFQTYFDSSASFIRLHLEHIRETPMQQNRHQVSFQNATLTVAYPTGARLEMNGSLNVLFRPVAPEVEAIELMELYTANSEEHVARSEIEKIIANYSPNMANKNSPKMTKNKLPKAQQKMQSQQEGLTIDHFPKVSTGALGVTQRVQQFLEIDETMCVMADLIAYAQEKRLRPEQALEAMVAQYEAQGGPNAQQQQGNPQIHLPPNGVAMGNRTPSMQHMQTPNAAQFSSPSVSHLGLPMQNGMMNGSPSLAHNAGLAPNMNMPNSHTPSPHQANMAAPAMMPQHSQQGTNSSGAASTNTSPNVNNKRRRSTVKLESEDSMGADGGGPQGANRVKPSPRMPKKNKPGGA